MRGLTQEELEVLNRGREYGPNITDLIRAGEVTLEQALEHAAGASAGTKRKWAKAAAVRAALKGVSDAAV